LRTKHSWSHISRSNCFDTTHRNILRTLNERHNIVDWRTIYFDWCCGSSLDIESGFLCWFFRNIIGSVGGHFSNLLCLFIDINNNSHWSRCGLINTNNSCQLVETRILYSFYKCYIIWFNWRILILDISYAIFYGRSVGDHESYIIWDHCFLTVFIDCFFIVLALNSCWSCYVFNQFKLFGWFIIKMSNLLICGPDRNNADIFFNISKILNCNTIDLRSFSATLNLSNNLINFRQLLSSNSNCRSRNCMNKTHRHYVRLSNISKHRLTINNFDHSIRILNSCDLDWSVIFWSIDDSLLSCTSISNSFCECRSKMIELWYIFDCLNCCIMILFIFLNNVGVICDSNYISCFFLCGNGSNTFLIMNSLRLSFNLFYTSNFRCDFRLNKYGNNLNLIARICNLNCVYSCQCSLGWVNMSDCTSRNGSNITAGNYCFNCWTNLSSYLHCLRFNIWWKIASCNDRSTVN